MKVDIFRVVVTLTVKGSFDVNVTKIHCIKCKEIYRVVSKSPLLDYGNCILQKEIGVLKLQDVQNTHLRSEIFCTKEDLEYSKNRSIQRITQEVSVQRQTVEVFTQTLLSGQVNYKES